MSQLLTILLVVPGFLVQQTNLEKITTSVISEFELWELDEEVEVSISGRCQFGSEFF